ncbi:MAG: pyridoxamine kinase [Peptococcaceae bacterium]|nr:pyridoxamine kinase [Peptococcaceae bacterium]
MRRQKRVAAIHDISCLGRCSLTVALPILSAAGIETAVIPTAVLSTHTGGFSGYTYRDLTQDILPIVDHWQGLSLEFDGIYTGFLGSVEQVDIVMTAFDRLKGQDTLIAVDPVMADFGKLYPLFPPHFPAEMRRLCAKADLIAPNLTETALLLDEPYREGPNTWEDIHRMLRGLRGLGPKRVVITGVSFDGERLGAVSLDGQTGQTDYAAAKRIDPMYHGTGDIFASALTAALLHGRTLAQASEAAVRFTVDSIARTKAAGTDSRFGVNFEAGLTGLRALIENA